MRAELSAMRAAQRRGDIEDMTRPEAKTPRYLQLEAQFDSLVTAQRANMVKNEFDLILQQNGATFINAFTSEDMTVYFETVPANKLELWFWMESDRLQNRVFREFYSERDVVYEERRRSVESTPTGPFEVSFDAMFWDSSPYLWPVIGWPSDIANITKAQADEYYSLYYAPQNLTAILVGDFDPKQTLAMAEKYLGAIPRGPKPAPEMITSEIPATAEKRFYAEAETNPAVWVRWHAAAYVHRDVPALNVLEGLLNGPTGRLQKSLVLDRGIATEARASQRSRASTRGMFEIDGRVQGRPHPGRGGDGDPRRDREAPEGAGDRRRAAEGEEPLPRLELSRDQLQHAASLPVRGGGGHGLLEGRRPHRRGGADGDRGRRAARGSDLLPQGESRGGGVDAQGRDRTRGPGAGRASRRRQADGQGDGEPH